MNITRMNAVRRTLANWSCRLDRKGSILPLAALFLTAALGFVALVVDIGYILVTRTQCQAAADSAALAAAQELQKGSSTPTTSRSTATLLSGLNFPTNIPNGTWNEDVVLGTWNTTLATFTPLSGASEQQANAVKVTCSRSSTRGNALSLFFAPIFGRKHTNVTASAIARAKPSRCGLIIGLSKCTMSGSSYTDSYQSASGSYGSQTPGNNGHVCSNDDITMSGSAAIYGDAHFGIGRQLRDSSSIGVTGTASALTKALSYSAVAPGNASTVNSNSTIPLSDQGKQAFTSGELTLSGGDGVTLQPGTYYFKNLTLSGGSTLRIIGLTKIYVTEDVSISGSSMANSTLLPKNLQIYGMGAGKQVNISGSSDLYAVVYAPTCKVTRSGSASFFGSIVGGELTMSGDGGIHVDESLDFSFLGGGGSSKTTLVQ